MIAAIQSKSPQKDRRGKGHWGKDRRNNIMIAAIQSKSPQKDRRGKGHWGKDRRGKKIDNTFTLISQRIAIETYNDHLDNILSLFQSILI